MIDINMFRSSICVISGLGFMGIPTLCFGARRQAVYGAVGYTVLLT